MKTTEILCYAPPEAEIIRFESNDIMTMSGNLPPEVGEWDTEM